MIFFFVLTRCGASVDWKCSKTPMTDICSSHLRLVSLLSSWYSPALLNRHRRAVSSCSASVHRAPVAAWQKITSRRSCREVSVVVERNEVRKKRMKGGQKEALAAICEEGSVFDTFPTSLHGTLQQTLRRSLFWHWPVHFSRARRSWFFPSVERQPEWTNLPSNS